MMGDMALGNICVRMMRGVDCPASSAACTKSRWRSVRNSLRTRRATGGHETMAMAATMELTDGVKIATSTMASAKLGTAWKISVKRMSAESIQPPK
jgi:hypothetical protein